MWCAVSGPRHDVALVIAGDQGTFIDSVTAELARAGIADHARVIGHVTTDDLVSLYTGAEAFVFTSAYEGFGLPPLEAMACGTPAVVFDNSSIAEVSGGAADVVRDGDTAAMAAAINRLLDDPAEQREAAFDRTDVGRDVHMATSRGNDLRGVPHRPPVRTPYSFSVTWYSRYAPNMRRVCASSAGMTLSARPTTGYVNSCNSAQRLRHHGHSCGFGQIR